MAERMLQRRLAAILAADMVGYSRLIGADEEGTIARQKDHRGAVIDREIAGHGGRIVKTMGDGLLVEFSSVVDAVKCGLAIQQGVSAREAGVPAERRIAYRIGINLGDIVIDGDDILGEGVNVAARLEGEADGGGICISADAYRQVQGKVDCGFEDMGALSLKNIARPVHAYRLTVGQASAAPAVAPRSGSPSSAPDKASIVVLPFDNMSGDPEQAYFSDGIAEDIMTDLSKISSLFVIARNTAFTYKGRAVDVRQTAAALGVRYVLEGSVRKAGNRVRVTAQLIDGASGGHVWADRYDRELADIFAVQDDVTGNIVKALKLHLTPREQQRVAARGPENIEAYDYFLRARDLMYRFTAEATAEARLLFEEAVRLSPGFSTPYALEAGAMFNEYLSGWNGADQSTFECGCQLARKAVELDPDDAIAHWALSVACLWSKDLDGAEREIEIALDLDPNFAGAYATRGNILGYAGKPDIAIECLEHSMRLNPEYPKIHLHFLAHAYFMKEDFRHAAELLERRIRLNPGTDISRVLLASCLGHLGRPEDARRAWEEALRINPHYSLAQKRDVLPYRHAADWRRIEDGLRKAGIPA